MPHQRTSTIRHRTSLFEEAVALVADEFDRDLARSYSEIGRTTFRSHLTAVRMDAAAEMLSAGSLTVREVAQRVGYRQPAQFAKAFRRHHGLSPSSYRARRRVAPNGHRRVSAAA
jgi:AraC family transcriptional regulator of adaptative response / methylphosphotriester-DNA alkyltransferase methyltransferase